MLQGQVELLGIARLVVGKTPMTPPLGLSADARFTVGMVGKPSLTRRDTMKFPGLRL